MASKLITSDDTIDAIRPDLETFTSLWRALRVTYGGSSIIKIISRLLNTYQPNDGIQAYERLLKTLFILLEDFDSNGLRLLVSMVPPPNGSSDEIIREVFFNATGFMRIDAPIFHENYSFLSSMENSIDEEIKNEIDSDNTPGQSINENIQIKLKNINTKENITHSEIPQVLSQDCYSFRGFPQTEIYSQNQNIQRHNTRQYFIPQDHHNKSIVNLSQSNYKMNWHQAPYCLQNTNSQQSNLSYREMLIKTMNNNKYLRVPVAHCDPNIQYFNRPYQIISTNRKIQSEDTHTITSGLLTDSSQFQCQMSGELYAKQEEKDNSDDVEKVRIHSDLMEHNYNLQENNEIKLNENIEEKKFNDINNDIVNCNNYVPITFEDSIIENLTPGNNLTMSIKNFLKRVQNDESLDFAGDTIEIVKNPMDDIPNKYNSQNTKNSQLQSQKFPDKNSFHAKEIKNDQNDTNDTSYNFNYQSNSISELAAYKRQYYDALLNIQRAKMAVANSLILSPIQNRNDYDSYHLDNLQQHHWVYQQPQRLMVGPSYGQRFIQPQYSGMHNTCVRSNDWIPSYPLSAISHENPLMHTSYDSRFIYSNHEPASQINDCIPIETKLEAKKRKLENIVVKLKENELK